MINEKRAFSYFRAKFGLLKSTSGWFTFNCPFCVKHKPNKMAVNFYREVVKCWLCGYKDSVVDFVMQFEGLKYWEARDFINSYEEAGMDFEKLETNGHQQHSNVEFPKGFVPIMSGDGILGKRARTYIEERHFALETVDRLGMGYCNEKCECEEDNYFGRIIIPYKRKGYLVYFAGRDFIGHYFRYKNPPVDRFGVGKGDVIFNEDALNLYDTVFITEGWADALTFRQYGVSTSGWSLSPYQTGAIKRAECENLVFVPDAGVDGQGVSFYKHAVKTAIGFLEVKKKVQVLNLDELSQFGKDANEIGRKPIIEKWKETKPLDMGTAIKILSE